MFPGIVGGQGEFSRKVSVATAGGKCDEDCCCVGLRQTFVRKELQESSHPSPIFVDE